MIAPAGAAHISITFTELSTQPGKDLVTVFQCLDISCSQQQQLAELSGLYATPQAVTSTTGYMKVVFTSDGSINYDGFKATWTSVSYLTRWCICNCIHVLICASKQLQLSIAALSYMCKLIGSQKTTIIYCTIIYFCPGELHKKNLDLIKSK
jgi:hypothetical protein